MRRDWQSRPNSNIFITSRLNVLYNVWLEHIFCYLGMFEYRNESKRISAIAFTIQSRANSGFRLIVQYGKAFSRNDKTLKYDNEVRFSILSTERTMLTLWLLSMYLTYYKLLNRIKKVHNTRNSKR